MRVGIDMLSVQSPGSRGRGVGRFGQGLVRAMLARGREHRFVLYAHEGLPTDDVPDGWNATTSTVRPEPSLRDSMERLARSNPDRLDVLLLINPFELVPGYEPPARPLGGLKVASVMHDLIPFLFQETYLADPPNAAWNYRRLRTLRSYDALLTNSEATRADCLRMLDLPGDRATTIGGAVDGSFFAPDRSWPLPLETRTTLHRLGIRRPFVFTVAGIDARKNLRGLIEAFSRLPESTRRTHHLVITCALNASTTHEIRRHAEDRGVGASLILTGELSDRSLRVLYQRCAAFAFPSLYEGLGLPLLEAMHCGAPVVAGSNSSQPEVVGEAGLLVNARDEADIAAALARVLDDVDLADELRRRGPAQAGRFSWHESASRALSVLEHIARPNRLANSKPRIAVFSPWNPKGSGIANYAERLIDELKEDYRIDLYHEPGYVPDIGLRSVEFTCLDHRLFDRRAALLGYRAVLYQMGNSFYHEFLYEHMARWPGIVTLHDPYLAAFHFCRAHRAGDPGENFRREVAACHPGRVDEIMSGLDAWHSEPGGVPEAFGRRGLAMNRTVLDWAENVIVHSPWCLEMIRRDDPVLDSKVVVIPHGADPRPTSDEHRSEVRRRFDLPDEALIFGCFGILSRGKMNVEAIEAFAVLARESPSSLLIFVGQDWERGEARDKVRELGLGSRVRFLGRQDDDAFLDLMAATDVGICLRRPPTFGETSGALLHLLRQAVPTIINDVATFSDYPDSVAHKVRWESEGLGGLVAAMRDLASEAERRSTLGRAGFEHVRRHHAWAAVARCYAEVIERCHEARRRAG